jgi:hypothetical protein
MAIKLTRASESISVKTDWDYVKYNTLFSIKHRYSQQHYFGVKIDHTTWLLFYTDSGLRRDSMTIATKQDFQNEAYSEFRYCTKDESVAIIGDQ